MLIVAFITWKIFAFVRSNFFGVSVFICVDLEMDGGGFPWLLPPLEEFWEQGCTKHL